VARQILAGYKVPQGDFPTDHIPTRREAARRKFADLMEAATTDA
jgi:acyl-CoA dehydrogenase